MFKKLFCKHNYVYIRTIKQTSGFYIVIYRCENCGKILREKEKL